MLILTRKKGEEIVINSNVVLTVLSTSDNQVKIGIDAPEDLLILRGELYHKVKETTIQASQKSKQSVKTLKDLKINKFEK